MKEKENMNHNSQGHSFKTSINSIATAVTPNFL